MDTKKTSSKKKKKISNPDKGKPKRFVAAEAAAAEAQAAERAAAQEAVAHKPAKADKPARSGKSDKPARPAKSSAEAKRAKQPKPAAVANDGKPRSPKSPCPVDARCGGCSSIAVPYDKQLQCKQRQMEELFEPFATDATIMEPILGMAEPFHYRNKVMSPFAPGRKLAGAAGAAGARGKGGKDGRGRDGKDGKDGRGSASRSRQQYGREILTGMYAKGTHQLIPTDTCLIENELAKGIIATIRDLCGKFNIAPYNEDLGTGFMRHAVIRVGHESGEVLVTLVTNEEEFPAAKAFCKELVRRRPAVTTVVQNVNTRQTNVVLGQRERTLYGPGFILDRLCGLSFRISSQSFYQVNCVQTEVLYQAAMTLAGFPAKGEDAAAAAGADAAATDAAADAATDAGADAADGLTCIDAYCGTGTIGLVAANQGAARVIGVESVASAVRDARQNAAHNGIENAQFVIADAGEFMLALAGRPASDDVSNAAAKVLAAGKVDPARTVLLMDPPRSGASEDFLLAAEALKPFRIVYISCGPQTQARDVEHLVKHGYRLDVVQPVDMFPHTDHVENIVLLSRV